VSGEWVESIQDFALPAEPPFSCAAWPKTVDAREAASRAIEVRINARLAIVRVGQAEALRIADEETLAYFGEKN
jgi:hypothetical protein